MAENTIRKPVVRDTTNTGRMKELFDALKLPFIPEESEDRFNQMRELLLRLTVHVMREKRFQ